MMRASSATPEFADRPEYVFGREYVLRREDDSEIPVPPDHNIPEPIKEPPIPPKTEPDAPVREPGPTGPKRL